MGWPGLKFLERPLIRSEALTPEWPIGFLANRCAKLYRYLWTYTKVLCHELIWRAILMLVVAVPSSGQQSGPRRHNLQYWREPTDISASPRYEHKRAHALVVGKLSTSLLTGTKLSSPLELCLTRLVSTLGKVLKIL